MRGSASTPALALLDDVRAAARQRATASLNRSQSLASNLPVTASARFSSLVQATPFFALPGVSSSVTNFTRSYSRAALTALNTSYGSVASSISRHSTSAHAAPHHHRMDSAASASNYTPFSPTPSTPSSSVSFAFDMGSVDDDDVIPDHQLNPPLTSPLLLAVTTAVLSSFQTGFNSALLNVPEPVIRASLALTDTDWSVVVSIFCIGGLLGCSLGGYLADALGRKAFLVSVNGNTAQPAQRHTAHSHRRVTPIFPTTVR